MWFLLFLPLIAWSQSDIDLTPIQDLESILPEHDIRRDQYRNIEFERKNREFRPPQRVIPLEEIRASDVSTAHLREGTVIYRIEDHKPFRLTKEMYVKHFRLQDELQYVYLRDNQGQMTYKVASVHVTSVAHELKLYEPPTKWSPAPENMVKTEYDRKLRLVPEAAFYLGVVQSRFVRDLFNDPQAKSGVMNQYAFHMFTEWNLPFKVGASAHYERSSYSLERGGNVFYESLSVGPQFRTRDFELFQTTWRLTTQIRVSPIAKMRGETVNGNVSFKFNSTDLMTTVEHPWSNRFGQFVLGGFHQMQWLNIKDQPEAVSIRAANQTNQGFGLFLAQVFQ